METILVIVAIFLCISVVLAITANIFYVASEGLYNLWTAMEGIFNFIRRLMR